MTQELVVLDLSRYNAPDIGAFCAGWSVLTGKQYSVLKPRLRGNELRRILPEQAVVADLFCLTPHQQGLPYIVFTPGYDIVNVTAWRILEASLIQLNRGVRIATLLRDVFLKGQPIYCTRMITYNSALL